jgi:hypothetical protein
VTRGDDFDLPAGHLRIAINLLAGTLNSTAPFSIAAASSVASTTPSQTAYKLGDVPDERLRRFWRFGRALGHGPSVDQVVRQFNRDRKMVSSPQLLSLHIEG